MKIGWTTWMYKKKVRRFDVVLRRRLREMAGFDGAGDSLDVTQAIVTVSQSGHEADMDTRRCAADALLVLWRKLAGYQDGVAPPRAKKLGNIKKRKRRCVRGRSRRS